MRITALHKTDGAKVSAVMAEMASLGAPTIRIVSTCYGLQAIEGTHRLEAAHRLGIVPIFVELADDDLESIIEGCDIRGDASPHTLSEIIEYIEMPEGDAYDF